MLLEQARSTAFEKGLLSNRPDAAESNKKCLQKAMRAVGAAPFVAARR